jgi:hypothetical protein
MTKKNIFLITATFLVVGFIYFYLYRDYFTKGDIQIFHTIRTKASARQRGAVTISGEGPNDIITFGMGHEYKLTGIRVVPLIALKKDKYAPACWELTSESNSTPARAFSYGAKIQGLHPKIKGAEPDPLLPNVDYRLFVEAGSLKGEHDFKIPLEAATAQQ